MLVDSDSDHDRERAERRLPDHNVTGGNAHPYGPAIHCPSSEHTHNAWSDTHARRGCGTQPHANVAANSNCLPIDDADLHRQPIPNTDPQEHAETHRNLNAVRNASANRSRPDFDSNAHPTSPYSHTLSVSFPASRSRSA